MQLFSRLAAMQADLCALSTYSSLHIRRPGCAEDAWTAALASVHDLSISELPPASSYHGADCDDALAHCVFLFGACTRNNVE